MVKVLLIILLMVICSKSILDSAAAACKDSIVKTTSQEEETKSDKEDNKKSKRHLEELDCNNPAEGAFAGYSLISPSYLLNQKPYSQFVNRLTTPPPNFI